MNTTIVIATAATSNYDFQAIAGSRQQANVLLHDAWAKHVRQTGADPHMMLEMINDGDVNYVEVPLGSVTRDGSLFHRG